jgi:cell wall-associated NlpC family hydrolase
LRASSLRTSLAASLLAAAVLSAGAGASHAQPSGGGAADLVLAAIGLIGTPYRYGGDRPDSGFDCSGLVRYVVRSALGVDLPRQAESISRAGVEVALQQLQPGDLVFFNTLGRPFSHVGFYVGEGQFIHAPAQRGRVRIEPMSQPYWQSRFDGARRLDALAGDPASRFPVAGFGSPPLAADGSYPTVEP